MDDDSPRNHHFTFKHLAVRLAIEDHGRFFETFSKPDGIQYLAKLWTAVGMKLPPEQQIPAEGLKVHCLPSREAIRFIVLELPWPAARNEALFIAAARPTDATEETFVYLLERSTHPTLGETWWFVVGFSRQFRTNFGPLSHEPTLPAFVEFVGKLRAPETN